MKTPFRLATLALTAVALLPFALATPTPYNHTDPRLVYDSDRSEDFSTESLIDTTKWNTGPQAVVGFGADDPANVTFTTSPGTVVITGHTIDLSTGTPVKGCYFTGGSITSKRRYGYGYYELCAQMPTGSGWSPMCLSVLGASNSFTLVQMDSVNDHTVLESCGFVSPTPAINGYPLNGNRFASFGFDSNKPDLTPISPKTGFHYYGLEWTPTELIWYVDGTEIHRISYPGPHSAVSIRLRLAAQAVLTGGLPADGVQFQARSFLYWTKDYDVQRRDASIVALPTELVTHNPDNGLAFAHTVFDWSTSGIKYTTRPSGTDTSSALASGTPAAPSVYPFYELMNTPLAKWNYPGSSSAAEVFVWNPCVYPTAYLQAEYGALPTTNVANYSFYGNGSTLDAVVPRDQLKGGQKWIWLGVHPFTAGSGSVVISPAATSQVQAIRAAAMQFRELNYFYDDFSSGLSNWTSTGGTWSTLTGGILAQDDPTSTINCFETRSATAAWTDYFVRAQVQFGGSSPAINAGLVGRYQGGGTYYLLRLARPATGASATLDILRVISGSATVLATTQLDSSIDPSAAPVDLDLFITGTTSPRLQGLANGQLVLDVTDTSGSAITTAGSAGVRTWAGTARFGLAGAGQ